MPDRDEGMTETLTALSDDALLAELTEATAWVEEDRQINQLLYYEPVSDRCRAIHRSTATILGIGGGNRSGKSESALVELIICATGVIPDSLKADFPRSKLRGPCKIRIVCESLTVTMHQVILDKLHWQHWDGITSPDDPTPKGHWGWIPKFCLLDGSWEKSWSDKYRTLKLLYRNPDKLDEVIGLSSIMIMSHDQHPTDFESGKFQHIMMDEPPSYAIFKANRARILGVEGGRLILAMTWPDNPAIPVEWIFDEIYEKGIAGPKKDPMIDWINLRTTENRFMDQGAVARLASGMSRLERLTRIEGQPIRFSNRIHPGFTDAASWWCLGCQEEVHPYHDGQCPHCESGELVQYCHVEALTPNPSWPVIFLLDPHPRKPHMMLWVQVDPNDDWLVLHEAEVQDDPLAVRLACEDYEHSHHLVVAQRLMDPNMGAAPGSSTRGITWQDEFEAAGVFCDLADDSGVGRARLNDRLKVDPHTKRPRIRVNDTCYWTGHQMKRYVWADSDKQKPKPEHDDYPTLLKYLANADPVFSTLKAGSRPLRLCAAMPGPRGY